jgi:hypothetical protein
LVLVDLIVRYVVAAVEEDDAITVIVDIVVLYPREAGLDGEDALRARLVDQVVEDDSVGRLGSTECNIGLVVLEDLVLLDVAT